MLSRCGKRRVGNDLSFSYGLFTLGFQMNTLLFLSAFSIRKNSARKYVVIYEHDLMSIILLLCQHYVRTFTDHYEYLIK